VISRSHAAAYQALRGKSDLADGSVDIGMAGQNG